MESIELPHAFHFTFHNSVTNMSLQGVLHTALLAQCLKLDTHILNGDHGALLLAGGVITVANVDSAGFLLRCTNDKDEVVLSQLTSANLLLHGVTADVNVNVELISTQQLLQFLNVVVHGRHDGNNKDLARAEPEWPLATEVLDQDTQESLETADDGTMDDDGASTAGAGLVALRLSLLGLILSSLLLVGHVLHLEVDRSLVIELNSGTLEFTLECIRNGDVDLRAIEGSISFINTERWC